MSAESSLPGTRTVHKICASCGARVPRDACHRNRYREYICDACRARGVRFTWRRRARHEWRKYRKNWGRDVVWVLGVAGAVMLTLFMLSRMLE